MPESIKEEYALKIRVKFSKFGNMRFIGHLDFLRYFQKAIRRSGIPIKYSEGFSPHQIMSFAAPLSIGVEGMSEYMDIELHENASISSKSAIKLLNQHMCEGVEVLSFKRLADNAKNSMSLVSFADYKVKFIDEKFPNLHADLREILDKNIANLLANDSIIVQKDTKTGIKEVDIRNLILDVSSTDDDIELAVNMKISQGSNQNLKPELLMQALLIGDLEVYKNYRYRYIRQELYDINFNTLESYGEDIE